MNVEQDQPKAESDWPKRQHTGDRKAYDVRYTTSGLYRPIPTGNGGGLASLQRQRHSQGMNRTDVMLQVVELAKAGGALPIEEAMCVIAAMIDRLDMHSESYEVDVAALMRLGATIWDLSGGVANANELEWEQPSLLGPLTQ